MAERLIVVQNVVGSSPIIHPNYKNHPNLGGFFHGLNLLADQSRIKNDSPSAGSRFLIWQNDPENARLVGL